MIADTINLVSHATTLMISPVTRRLSMTLKSHHFRAVLLAVLVTAMPAMASNLGFLKDAPYTHFTDEDHKIFNQTLDDTLNSGVEGEIRKWSNSNTNASGEMKPLKSFERNGLACRTLWISNKAKGRSATSKLNFCKQANGKWVLAN
jgi:hypothetical protein